MPVGCYPDLYHWFAGGGAELSGSSGSENSWSVRLGIDLVPAGDDAPVGKDSVSRGLLFKLLSEILAALPLCAVWNGVFDQASGAEKICRGGGIGGGISACDGAAGKAAVLPRRIGHHGKE